MAYTAIIAKSDSLVDMTAKYPSNWWRTPTYSDMYYILNTRTNASNLRTFGRVDIDGNGTYRNGLFFLPDDWVLPSGISMTITTANYTTNSYTLDELELIEDSGGVFFPLSGNRVGASVSNVNSYGSYWSSTSDTSENSYILQIYTNLVAMSNTKRGGRTVRLCKTDNDSSHTFSVSATSKIRFAKSNLKYHCLQGVWAFHEHSYDFIGADNANIDASYDGWIDLFGYGTSGINYAPTLHTTDNAYYCQTDLNGTENDWGYNKISIDSNPLDTRLKIYENKIRANEFTNL